MRGRGGAGPETTTASGIKITDLVEGTGASPKLGKTLKVNYTGTLENGTKFDSSLDYGKKPIEFLMVKGEVIKGCKKV